MLRVTAAFLQAARCVLRQRRRTAVAAGAIAFGVAALILAGGFIEWIFWATRQGTIQSGVGHITVSQAGYRSDGAADPMRYRLPANSSVLAELRALPGVRTVAPRLSFAGLVSVGETTLSFLGEGVDPESELDFGDVSVVSAGEQLSSVSPRGVLLGSGLAANLGAGIGDTVVFLANAPGGGVSAVEGQVRGLMTTVSKAYDDIAVRMPLPMAEQLLRVSGAHRWVVVLKDTEATDSQLAQLRSRYAREPLEFAPWYELADFYNKTVALLSRQMNVMFAIIGVIIVLTISNSMMMSVMERTAEIGTAMALGTRRSGVLAQFLGEGALLGAVGGLAGALIGVSLAFTISLIGIPMPPPPGQSRAFTAEIIVTAPLVLQAAGLAVLTALAAAVYPAWKASRIAIVDALRAGR